MRFPTGTVALTDVGLSLRPGDFVSVVGPSGCGKSTLLRLASGLETATSGSVAVTATATSYVFQDPTLLEWRTAARNVELVQELRGASRAVRRARAQEMLDLVGLTGFERQHPRALSGGMRMRVSIARALVAEPDLALFDEPFGALDEITRLQMQTELQKLFVLKRFAGLFITHSVSEAVYLSTRVLVMSGRPGRIVAEIAGAVGLSARAVAALQPGVRHADRSRLPGAGGALMTTTQPTRQPRAAGAGDRARSPAKRRPWWRTAVGPHDADRPRRARRRGDLVPRQLRRAAARAAVPAAAAAPGVRGGAVQPERRRADVRGAWVAASSSRSSDWRSRASSASSGPC